MRHLIEEFSESYEQCLGCVATPWARHKKQGTGYKGQGTRKNSRIKRERFLTVGD